MIYRVGEGNFEHFGINYGTGKDYPRTRFIVKVLIPLFFVPKLKMYRDFDTGDLRKGIQVWAVRIYFRLRTFKNPTLCVFKIQIVDIYKNTKLLHTDEEINDVKNAKIDLVGVKHG